MWALVDITKSGFKNPIMRAFLLMLILFLPVLGALFYFQFRRKLLDKAPLNLNGDLSELTKLIS